MRNYNNKTKEELLEIIGQLEKKTEYMSSESLCVKQQKELDAAKFTPKGEIHFGYREKGNFVEFYVKDSGIGIAAERAATIFRRFGKVNDFIQGTGLGLTLCRMLVEKMGGRIWLRSQEGKGSRFYFTLPLIHV